MNIEQHLKQDPCFSRPPYRDGRKKTVIKSYCISQESCYLIIFGVPAIDLRKNIKNKCKNFGEVDRFYQLTDHVCIERFTEAFVCKYNNLSEARFAKRKLDDLSFFGNILHVTFAPELETVAECRLKLHTRRNQMRRVGKRNDPLQNQHTLLISNPAVFIERKITSEINSEGKQIEIPINGHIDLHITQSSSHKSRESGEESRLSSGSSGKKRICEQPQQTYSIDLSLGSSIVPVRVIQNLKRRSQIHMSQISNLDGKKSKICLEENTLVDNNK